MSEELFDADFHSILFLSVVEKPHAECEVRQSPRNVGRRERVAQPWFDCKRVLDESMYDGYRLYVRELTVLMKCTKDMV